MLNGNPGKRALPKDEAQPKRAPRGWKAPAHLKGEGRAEWNRLVAEMIACGLLTEVDRAALAAYCTIYARWYQAQWMLRRHGLMVTTPNGFVQPSAWLTVSRQAESDILQFAAQFGMTPAARTRISALPPSVTPPKEDEPETPKGPPAGKFTGLIGRAN